MKQKKQSAESKIKEIKRITRKKYSAEEKIRIVIEGLRGELSIAELCRKEGINANLYYKWSKDFLEAGKSRLTGNTKREANTNEVNHLKNENTDLKQLVAELSLENRMLKKSLTGRVNYKYMRRSASEKMEIIRIVQDSELGVKRTLEELGVSRSSFYEWYNRYLTDGFDGLKPKPAKRRSFWNKIPDKERAKVIDTALEQTELSPRELAYHITDTQGWFISESSVYRILKSQGLITSPAWIVMAASDEFKDKPSKVHQQWQTDFTYFKIIGWGWYYLATVMDDYSRYIVTWELCRSMESTDAMNVINKALATTSLPEDGRPRLLSDNGSCYISHEFQNFMEESGMGHVRGAPYHPQTQGKIERYHRTMKNIVKLDNYYYPDDLRASLEAFVNYYNNERYHESLHNLTPSDVYFGTAEQRLHQRMQIKKSTMKERRRKNRKAAS
ncbi:IS3 family transposase [Carboxylicivirga sp. RSCT41]|uniref:IS3 family transposase n=1 Tax=Carboxylicivirga agarovorans TaxID=3417570 RepID=UPI003D327CFF